MIAYTNYRSDPRVIREAEAALAAGFAVDFLCLRRDGEAALEEVRTDSVREFHLSRTAGDPLYPGPAPLSLTQPRDANRFRIMRYR